MRLTLSGTVLIVVGAGLLAGALAPVPISAQGRGCTWVEPTRSIQSFTIPGQGQIFYLGRPTIRCADGVRIQADSAVVYPNQNMSHLMGRVRFRDGSKELQADEGRYFSQQGRLQTQGHTVLRDTLDGSEIRNGDMVLLRETETRDQEQITVTTGADGLRPEARLRLKPKPDTAAAEDPGSGPGRTPLLGIDIPPGDTAGRPPPPSEAQTDTAGVVVPADPDTSVALAPDTQLPTVLPQDADTAANAAEPEALPDRGAPPDTVATPYVVVGDRIFLQGDEYFLATGDVVVDRDSLKAYADTAEYDQVGERMLLRGSARVDGDSYDLVGKTINIALPGGQMSSVRALREALLIGEDLRLQAPLIQLFLNQGAMERLVATPLPGDPSAPPRTAADSADLARPVADAEGFRLTADSVEVHAPGEVLNRIFAAGTARGESSTRDSLNVPTLPEIARTDWLEGDTVIATFSKVETDPLLPPPDSAVDEYRLDQLRAVGSAKSLYRLLPSDSSSRPGVDPPAVHYVTGSVILIVMADGEVDHMEVDGPTQGWHLEPERRPAQRDSLLAPDSVLVPPDTSLAPPDTAAAGPGQEPPGDEAGARGREEEGPPARRDGDDAALPAGVPGQRVRGRRSRR